MQIGIDFDNTIAGYDDLFVSIAFEAGWLEPGFLGGKKAVRDRMRTLPNGEDLWTGVQALVYGPRMAEARLIDGVGAFLRVCRTRGHDVAIVSHKTRFAAADPNGTDLRFEALQWMERQGFFSDDGFALSRENVHFTDSRKEKCERIGALGCSLFIDDLEEVFRDPAFPPAVDRILFHPGDSPPVGPFRVFADWRTLGQAVLFYG